MGEARSGETKGREKKREASPSPRGGVRSIRDWTVGDARLGREVKRGLLSCARGRRGFYDARGPGGGVYGVAF